VWGVGVGCGVWGVRRGWVPLSVRGWRETRKVGEIKKMGEMRKQANNYYSPSSSPYPTPYTPFILPAPHTPHPAPHSFP